MPYGNLDYKFSEPLFETNGFQSSDIEGVAEVAYSPDGGWRIEALYLDGWSKQDHRWIERKLPLAKDSPIYQILHDRLMTGKRAKHIRYDVLDDIEAMKEAAE